MEGNAYTVQKLARCYWVTRLAEAGETAVAKDLGVESTPLGSLATTILGDLGLTPRADVSESFAQHFLHPLTTDSHGIVTISASRLNAWAASELASAA